MIRFKANYVSATEAGDSFQVLFEEQEDREERYFLIQRGFEFDEDFEEPDLCYIESHEESLCGFPKLSKMELDRNSLSLTLAGSDEPDMVVEYEASDEDHREIQTILKIILGGITCLQTR